MLTDYVNMEQMKNAINNLSNQSINLLNESQSRIIFQTLELIFFEFHKT